MVEPSAQSQPNFGFVTPVQFIAQLLVDLRSKYFMDETPEFELVRKNIQYSLEKLNNKQSLFQVDTDLTDAKKTDEVSVASSMMDQLQDGLFKMLKKKNPEIVLAPSALKNKRRNTTILAEKSWMREYSSINMELIQNKTILSRQNSRSKYGGADSDQSMSTPQSSKLDKAHSLNTI